MSSRTEFTQPLVPADAGTQFLPNNQSPLCGLWIPAFAGMSGVKIVDSERPEDS
jgi:hypothetical protein